MALEWCLGVALGSGLLLLATQESAQARLVQTATTAATTEKAPDSVGETTEEPPQKPAAQAPSSSSRVRKHSVTREFVGTTIEVPTTDQNGSRIHRLARATPPAAQPTAAATLAAVPWTSLYAANCFFPSRARGIQSGGPFAWGLGSSLGLLGDPSFIAQMTGTAAQGTSPHLPVLAPTGPLLLPGTASDDESDGR